VIADARRVEADEGERVQPHPVAEAVSPDENRAGGERRDEGHEVNEAPSSG